MKTGSLLALLLCGAPALADDQITDVQRAELARYFGFDALEIYKFKRGIGQLHLADLNGDGRKDIIFWNPVQSRIEVLSHPDPNAPQSAVTQLERNEIPNRGALVNTSIPVTYRIASLDVGEFTGDGIPDIVFFGEPRELVILPGTREGRFGQPIPIRAPEGDPRGGGLAVGDLTGDGRADVALLGENQLLVFPQRPEGGLGKPARYVHNIPNTQLMLPADLNGDGRCDLIIGTDDREFGALVFLQDAGGTLGAMQRVRVPPLRSITIARGVNGDDVFVIESATGRLKVMHWGAPAERSRSGDWPQWLFSFPVLSKAKQQPLAVGDITGDGHSDVVAVDPDASQMVLFRGGPNGLQPGVAFPTLSKTLDVIIGDLDGDGVNELLCVSAEEKMIGVSRFEEGRLTFPTALADLPVTRPFAVGIGALTPDAPRGALACVGMGRLPVEKTVGEGKGGEDKPRDVPLLCIRRPDGEMVYCETGELKDDPSGLRFVDVNQDGLADILLFVRFAPPILFLQTSAGTFERFEGPTTRAELVKDATIEGFDTADVTGDGKLEVLLAQKNMARALVVRDGRWTVIDQYNPESGDAEIAGVAALPSAEGGPPILTLYDRKSRDLLVLTQRDDRTYAVTQTLPVGAFDLRTMAAAPLAAGGAPALLMSDPKKLVLIVPHQRGETLMERFAYETIIRDGFLQDSTVGDVNGDGVRDVVAVEARKANLELLTTLPDGSLVKVLHWQVFQGKRFSEEPDRGGEPREVLLGDVNGDGRDDVVLIAHDRVIVYPGQ